MAPYVSSRLVSSPPFLVPINPRSAPPRRGIGQPTIHPHPSLLPPSLLLFADVDPSPSPSPSPHTAHRTPHTRTHTHRSATSSAAPSSASRSSSTAFRGPCPGGSSRSSSAATRSATSTARRTLSRPGRASSSSCIRPEAAANRLRWTCTISRAEASPLRCITPMTSVLCLSRSDFWRVMLMSLGADSRSRALRTRRSRWHYPRRCHWYVSRSISSRSVLKKAVTSSCPLRTLFSRSTTADSRTSSRKSMTRGFPMSCQGHHNLVLT